MLGGIENGTPPNLAIGYSAHVPAYNELGAVTALDIFINDDTYGFTESEIADLFEGIFIEGKALGDDKTYLLTFAKNAEVLYYNKTYFTQQNLTVPTTWDEMETLLRTIKEQDPSCIPLAFDSESNLFLTLVAQLGMPDSDATAENPFIFNRKEYRKIVERLRTWYQNGWITTTELWGGYGSNLFTSNDVVNCYMTIGSISAASYNNPHSRFEVGIAPIPQLDKTNPKVFSSSSSLCIFENEDPQKEIASWLFLKHLITDTSFQTSYAVQTGSLPVAMSAIISPEYISFLLQTNNGSNENIKSYAAAVALDSYGATFVTNAFVASSPVVNAITNIITECLTYDGNDVTEYIKSVFYEAANSCNETPADPTSEYFNEKGELILFEDGVATFQIVIANDAISKHLSEVRDLAYTLSELSNSDIDVKPSGEKAQDVEILIGVVANRGEEYAIDKSEYGSNGFAVKQVGTKIIVVAANKNSLSKAIDYLRSTVFCIRKYNEPFDDLVMSADKNYDQK